jgi:hypothetical protein
MPSQPTLFTLSNGWASQDQLCLLAGNAAITERTSSTKRSEASMWMEWPDPAK